VGVKDSEPVGSKIKKARLPCEEPNEIQNDLRTLGTPPFFLFFGTAFQGFGGLRLVLPAPVVEWTPDSVRAVAGAWCFLKSNLRSSSFRNLVRG